MPIRSSRCDICLVNFRRIKAEMKFTKRYKLSNVPASQKYEENSELFPKVAASLSARFQTNRSISIQVLANGTE